MITFVKQYGEKRTGTNYLWALLAANYPAVTPLMHVLGDKHSAPVNFETYLQNAECADEPDWEFVRSATYAAPAESTRPTDPHQLDHMKRIAGPVARSVRAGTIGFAISVKHPHAWASSFVNFYRWARWEQGRLRIDPICGPALIDACHNYNRKYRAWLDHHARFESRSVIVRHEDLLEDAGAVLLRMEKTFNLQRAGERLSPVRYKVLPADWDHYGPGLDRREFDPDYYRKSAYFALLTAELWRVVDDNIDWGIAGELGYRK